MARPNPRAILVLGLEKSGTTAIAALLARRAGVSMQLDIPALWGDSERAIREGRLSMRDFVARNRFDFSKAIVKEPCLTLLHDELLEAFPEGRYVAIVRDPRTWARSIYSRLKFDGHDATVNLDALDPATDPSWKMVMDGRWLGLPGPSHLEFLAQRWNLAADLLEKHRAGTMVVRYEDFLADKAGFVDSLAERLGLPRTNDISGELDRQFQPRGRRDTTLRDFFGEANLRRIESICAERMARHGYAPTEETAS